MSTCVILNPAAGRGVDPDQFKTRLSGVRDLELRISRRPGDAVTLARSAAASGFGTIAAAGGDGTVSEVVTGLADHLESVRLACIPIGTGNDFALSAGLPLNLDAAVDVLRSSTERRVDTIRLAPVPTAPESGGPVSAKSESDSTGILYLNAAVIGFAGRIADRLDASMRRRWGALMYLRAAISELADLKPYRIRLTFDGMESVDVEALMVIVANGPHAGAGLPLAPGASLDDGELDVVIIGRRTIVGALRLIPSALRGTHLNRPGVTLRRARSVILESSPAAWVNVDGETAGARPFEFTVLPRSLRVAVPG